MATATGLASVTGEYVVLDGEQYYRIANSHLMPDFFMSLVGASDHWMFISSNGALTAGRRNPDLALFPYGPDDQISAARADTGSTTLLRIDPPKTRASAGDFASLWEPFARHPLGAERLHRNLYKTPLGNKLVLEEVNESLHLAFRYRWAFSERFGFVRSCRLENFGNELCSFGLLDGLRNVLPYGVGSEFLMRFSNLANAYKKSELVPVSNVGLFYLSSIPTDRAEPSEGLKATTVWQAGLKPQAIMLCTDQMQAFRAGQPVQTETDVRGKVGAYLLSQSAQLAPGEVMEWHIVSELAQDHAAVVGLDDWLQRTSDPLRDVADDVQASQQEFLRIVSSSDGIQCSANQHRANRHLSNTVFNVMRGGVPLENYQVRTHDFVQHVEKFNLETYRQHQTYLTNLPSVQSLAKLRDSIAERNDPHLTRLGLEYLPLAFSRRHGDPTRPWNRFSIELRTDDGRANVNYQGNWRDIFQNWEALLWSFPEFSTAMICRFVNATTADGYNPYRLTKDGFEWEEPTPDDPWANIGYWGDHQIIYLLKLLEWSRCFQPRSIDSLLNSSAFVHANVPYRIRDFESIKNDARDTIDFDADLSVEIRERVAILGADGKLLRNRHGSIHYVTLVEKLLTLSLAKLSNFVPDGGIWMNTQRPEWNDANNALVGNGLSIVTACYLHRWFTFLHDWLSKDSSESFHVSREVAVLFYRIDEILKQRVGSLTSRGDSHRRSEIVEALGRAGGDFRNELYDSGLSGVMTEIARQDCLEFFETARRHLEATIRNNQRADGLYHAYNLIDWQEQGVEIEHLYEMLEGQVAALSSGILSATEVAQLLDALRKSALYRENQNSYLLYPDRQLPRFLEKNVISGERLEASALLQKLMADGGRGIVSRDVRGGIHFNGKFRNSSDLRAALEELGPELGPEYELDVRDGASQLIQIFDEIFGHRQFTGRSGTFFAYEGLGSIYWHMVSKLALAVSENIFWAIEAGQPQNVIESLKLHLTSIRRGIGAEKSPSDYGAFPSDPYSHTPENAGVKQPGMTGQVKEDILARFAEVGAHIEDGCLSFRLDLFDQNELLDEASEFTFCDLAGEFRTIRVPQNGLGFTLFQVPFTYQPAETDAIQVDFVDGKQVVIDGLRVDTAISRQLFARSGTIEGIKCRFRALAKVPIRSNPF